MIPASNKGSKLDKDALNEILDRIIYQEPTWHASDWARASGLCESTCYRLLYRLTERPQFRSVLRMARAVGFIFDLVQPVKRKKAA